jgi:hypothetical protein
MVLYFSVATTAGRQLAEGTEPLAAGFISLRPVGLLKVTHTAEAITDRRRQEHRYKHRSAEDEAKKPKLQAYDLF